MVLRLLCAFFLLALPGALRAQDSARVLERYRQLVERRPGPGIALDRFWESFNTRGKTDQLIDEYRARADSGNAAAGLVLGYLLEKAGDHSGARAAFQAVAETDPGDPRPWDALAHLAKAAGDSKAEARAWEAAAARTDPAGEKAERLLAAGQAWARARKMEDAARLWTRTLALRPGDPALLRQLAEAYADAGKIGEAAAQWEALTSATDPYDRVTALREMSRLYQRAGLGDEAIAALHRALPLAAPGNWLRDELIGEIIRLHQRNGRIEELEAAWRKEVADNPRDRSRLLQLIALYHQTAQLDREREWLGRLVELMPEERTYRLRLAHLLERQNRLEEAAAAYDRLLIGHEDDPDLHLARAELDLRLGRTAAAASRWPSLLRKHPEYGDQALAFYRDHRLTGPEEDLLRQRLEAEPNEERILELANFLFEQNRATDALRVLYRLLDLGAVDARPARWARVAEVLEEKGRRVEAVQALQHALDAEPARPAWLMQMADLQKALGHQEDALASARRAVLAAGGTPQESSVDERYHQFLSEAAPGALPEGRRLAPPAAGGAEEDWFLSRLQADLEEDPSPAKYLRLARWQLLDRAYPAALASANSALELDPSNLDARKFALRVADVAGLYPEAISLLEDLIRTSPGQAGEYRRQIAEMKQRAGRVEDALADYSTLLERAPGDFALLTAQARALQGAERWMEALEAWRKAWATGSLPEKRSLLPTMLQILQRLGRDDVALELQLEMLDRETDPRSRETLLRDALRLARESDQNPRFLDEIQKRLRDKPQDAFLQIALAQILQAAGRDDEALDALVDASYATGAPEPLLEQIVSLADAQGRYEMAIETQQRLIWSRPELRAGDFVRLAELQEQWLDLEGARHTWQETVSRFGTDTALLKKATNFYLRWQFRDQALALLQQLRRLAPDDQASLLSLAKVATEAGQNREALSAAEDLLQGSSSSAEPEWSFPEARLVDAGKLQQAYFRAAQLRRGMPDADVMQEMQAFWTRPGSAPGRDHNRRLEAIRMVAQLRAQPDGGGRLEAWLRPYDRAGADPIEALWAAYYAGDEARVMHALQGLLEKEPRDLRIHQAFVWLTLQMGRYEDLRPWLEQTRGRGAEYRDLFAIAFAQFLDEAAPAEVERAIPALFPPKEHSRLLVWQTATQLAGQSHFRIAADLASRLLGQGGDSLAQCSAEIGAWYAHAGEPEKARQTWQQGAAGEGDTFDDLRYENLRRYLLTLPLSDLHVFADQAEQTSEGSAIHRAIVRVLANGLCRREPEARRAIDDLLALRPVNADVDSPATWRYWRFILTGGVQLQMWGMNRLAVYLWDEAAGDPAEVALSEASSGAVTSEIQLRRFGASLLEMPPEGVSHAVALFRARSTGDARTVFASLLEWVGQFRHGVEAMRTLLEQEPQNLAYLRTLLSVAGPGNIDTVLACAKAGIADPASDPATAQLAQQYLDYFTKAGAFDAAHAVLDDLGEAVQTQPALLERRAQLYVAQERWTDAAVAYSHLLEVAGDSATYTLPYAEVLRQTGRLDEAIELLRASRVRPAPGQPSPDAALARLHLEKNEIPAAIRCARRLIGEAAPPELRPLAEQFAGKGQGRFAQVLLYGIAPDNGEFGGRIWNEAAALELADPDEQPELRTRGMARLETAARANPELQPFYYQALEKLLPSRAAYLERLQMDWAAGHKVAGDLLAGAAQTRAELPRDFLDQATPGQLVEVARTFRKQGNRATAATLAARAVARQPQQDDWRFELIDDLLALNRNAAAEKHFDIIRVRSALNGSLLAPLARAMARAGQESAARAELEQATEWDTAGSDPESLLAYAHLLLRNSERSLAAVYLRRAYQNTRNTEFAGAVEYVRSAGNPGAAEGAMEEIGLDPSQQKAVRQALEESP